MLFFSYFNLGKACGIDIKRIKQGDIHIYVHYTLVYETFSSLFTYCFVFCKHNFCVGFCFAVHGSHEAERNYANDR